MLDQKQRQGLHQRLVTRRKELVDSRQALGARWQELQKAEVEFEETAQKASLSENIDQLDAQEKEEWPP